MSAMMQPGGSVGTDGGLHLGSLNHPLSVRDRVKREEANASYKGQFCAATPRNSSGQNPQTA